MKYNSITSITESDLKGEVDYYNRHFDRFNLKNMKSRKIRLPILKKMVYNTIINDMSSSFPTRFSWKQ